MHTTHLTAVKPDPLCPAQQQPLWLANNVAAGAPTLHQGVEISAHYLADKTALIDDHQSLTFGQLNDKANQLARTLLELGVKPADRVGVYLERTVNNYVALLAVLKLGAAYVPLEASLPDERLKAIAMQAGFSVIISQSAYLPLAGLMVGKVAGTVCNIDDPAVFDLHAPVNLEIGVSARHTAYMIFTSGSTGKPKGVAVSHGSVVALLHSMQAVEGIENDDCWLSLATLAFDISVVETFFPLRFGGTLVIGQKDWIFEPQKVQQAIEQHEVSVIQQTPAAWKLLMAGGWSVAQPLKIICCGEAFGISQAKMLAPHAKRLWNFYGPTEATVYACYHEVQSQSLLESSDIAGAVPIGKAMENYRLYLLDDQLMPVSEGEIGTLYIGGVGVAQQYWQDPVQTAEYFIPDLFGGGDGDRIYNTRDRVLLNTDGNLVYVSRSDNQVKIHGYRIELGEIEAAIMQYDDVVFVLVLALTTEDGDKQLVAYVEPAKGRRIEVSGLRDHLSALLPYYMVPGAVEVIDTLPLNAAGKVDHKLLPPPRFEHRQAQLAAPENLLETQLLSAWQQVLGKQDFGVCDSFFVLGGHSLMAIGLIKVIGELTGQSVNFLDIIAHPTIRLLATALGAKRQKQEHSPQEHSPQEHSPQEHSPQEHSPQTMVHDAVNAHQTFPLSKIQQAYWIGSIGGMTLGNAGCYNYLEVALSDIVVAKLEQAINRLIARHDMLRVQFTDDGQQRVQPVVAHYAPVFYPLHELSDERRQTRLLEIARDMTFKTGPFDCNRIFDVRLSRLAENRFRLHTMLNIMVLDATSMHVFFSELAILLDDPKAQLPPLDITFRDYMVAEQQSGRQSLFAAAKAYWQGRIDTLPMAPDLPLVKAPNQVGNPFFSRRMKVLAPHHWQDLQSIAAQHAITPSVLLLTAFTQVIGLWSQSNKFTLNLTLFNRYDLHPQINSVIGDLTSVNLLAVEHRPGLSFIDKAKAVQRQLWADLEHRHYSGIEVLRDINHQSGSHEPILMPVVFNSELGLNQASGHSPVAAQLSDRRYGISQTPQVWMDVGVFEADGELVLTLDALDEIFPQGMLDDLLDCYHENLLWLADDAHHWQQQMHHSLPKSQQMMRDRVNSLTMALPTALLHQDFERQARVNPQAIGVITASRSISYGQLNQAANHIAAKLTANGVAVNELVAVLMVHGWEQIVAVLGILKAGAAYLPIHGDFPQSRVELLLQQSGARQIITQRDMAQKAQGEYQTMVLDEQVLLQTGLPDPQARQSLTDLAYVIFTSGSTGLPKGVAIDHRGAANTINSINAKFNVTADDCVFALSSLSFDLSVYDIFGLLAVGGRVVMPDPQKDKDPAHWHQLVQANRVTLWNTVPALMQMYIDYLEQPDQPSGVAAAPIRQVMLSGDWIPLSLPGRIRSQMPQAAVESMGGATEASIWSIGYPIDQISAQWKSIPYGKPLANQTYQVLKADLSPCPDWVTGELYIGGVGVAKGYWGDQEKTASHFITDANNGEIIYRTGDLGRYCPDGNIEFLGRKDTQVKIQGYRIELGEIEAAINQLPQVKESLVIACRARHGAQPDNAPDSGPAGEQGDKILAAYVVWDKPPAQSAAAAEKARQKTLFKLQRAGLRQDLADADAVALAPFELDQGLQQHFDAEMIATNEVIGARQLSGLLRCLAEITLADAPLPKYFYPSSGGLNPVQAYLEVTAGAIEGLGAGIYYYDPLVHRLMPLPPTANAAGNATTGTFGARLTLIGRRAAIEPAYEQQGEFLCRIEAGYIQALLTMTATAQQLALRTVTDATDATDSSDTSDSVLRQNGCDSNDWLLTRLDICTAVIGKTPMTVAATRPVVPDGAITLTKTQPPVEFRLGIFERQSYRHFNANPLNLDQLSGLLAAMPRPGHISSAVCIGIKPGGIDTLAAGFYRYDQDHHQLLPLCVTDDTGESLYGGDNGETWQRSALAIYMVGDAAAPVALADAGRCGQYFSSFGAKMALGLCAIGGFNQQPIVDRLGLAQGSTIIHSMLGGGISRAQSFSWMQQPEPAAISVDFATIKQALDASLPGYMIPAVFTALPELPLTANGKVDRKRLPPADFSAQQQKNHVPPVNDIQKTLATMWQQALSLPQVGIHDHFFALGGSSTLLVNMRSLIKRTLGIQVEVADLFRYSTIDKLSAHLLRQTPPEQQAVEQQRNDKLQRNAQRQRQMAQRARQGRQRTTQNNGAAT